MKCGNGRSRHPAQRGIALLLVVWLLALLAVIGGEFMASGRVRLFAEANKRDDLRALALALSGYRLAIAALDEDLTALARDDDGTLLLQSGASPKGVKAAGSDVRLADGSCSWSVRNEDGLVNVNDENLSRSVLVNLLKACGVGPGAERDTIIDSILDWRDANREHRLNGAEEDFYRALDLPYSCKDGPLDVVEELLLVKGVSEELFAGRTEAGKKRPGLRDLVSPHAGGFNPGTAPDEVLEAWGRAREVEQIEVITHFAIEATGVPSGGGAQRHLRAVVRREDKGGSREFTLLYWNDSHFPPVSEQEGGER